MRHQDCRQLSYSSSHRCSLLLLSPDAATSIAVLRPHKCDCLAVAYCWSRLCPRSCLAFLTTRFPPLLIPICHPPPLHPPTVGAAHHRVLKLLSSPTALSSAILQLPLCDCSSRLSRLFVITMNSMPFAAGTPPPWHMIPQHNTPVSTSLWEPGTLQNNLQDLRDTLDLAKAMKTELEILILSKERGSLDDMEDVSLSFLSKWLKEKKISLEMQESYTLEAANSLLSTLKCQIEPFTILTNQASSWEEKSAVARVNDKISKYKRNKLWRKRKRKKNAEMRAKERERFDLADQEADDWRAREIAKDIARRKVEKMKEIARGKSNEERKRLESELELVLIVEKLQELRSIRIQKLKKQGHFLPEEDDKFLERVRAAVEEEERQAAASADTDAAKDAIATVEELRKTVNSDIPDIKGISVNENGDIASQGQVIESEDGRVLDATDLKSEQRGLDGPSSGGAYNSVANLPLEFYHYYHGSNADIGTLIEVRRTWDQYIRPGGSQIPGHWVQPPPPANEIWASYLVEHKD